MSSVSYSGCQAAEAPPLLDGNAVNGSEFNSFDSPMPAKEVRSHPVRGSRKPLRSADGRGEACLGNASRTAQYL